MLALGPHCQNSGAEEAQNEAMEGRGCSQWMRGGSLRVCRPEGAVRITLTKMRIRIIAGLEKTRFFFLKPSPVGFFGFLGFLSFLGFFA